MTKPALSV